MCLGCALVPTFFLLLQDMMLVGLGVQVEKRSLEPFELCFGAGHQEGFSSSI